MTVNLNAYKDFVEAVTSEDSNSPYNFARRIENLAKEENLNPSLLLTGAIGMASESGEFLDIVKKIAFHGKEVTPELREKLMLELGDCQWYWVNACRALNLDPNEVIAANVKKLEARHPDGKFNVEFEKTREAQ
jgi:NTP pyrophosphatase (non-canonical NTP hydrolase)